MRLTRVTLPILAATAILLTGCKSSFDELAYRVDLHLGSERAASITRRFMNDIYSNNVDCSAINSEYVKSCSIRGNDVFIEMGNFGETDLTISVRGDRDRHRVYCDVNPKKLVKDLENNNCSDVYGSNSRRLGELGHW